MQGSIWSPATAGATRVLLFKDMPMDATYEVSDMVLLEETLEVAPKESSGAGYIAAASAAGLGVALAAVAFCAKRKAVIADDSFERA